MKEGHNMTLFKPRFILPVWWPSSHKPSSLTLSNHHCLSVCSLKSILLSSFHPPSHPNLAFFLSFIHLSDSFWRISVSVVLQEHVGICVLTTFQRLGSDTAVIITYLLPIALFMHLFSLKCVFHSGCQDKKNLCMFVKTVFMCGLSSLCMSTFKFIPSLKEPWS